MRKAEIDVLVQEAPNCQKQIYGMENKQWGQKMVN